jgi:hypothetical protein
MTDPHFTEEVDRDLLVVLPTREEAEEAARRLQEAGIPAEEILVARDEDRVTSMRAEMHEELTESYTVPNAGVVYTKEATRGLVFAEVVGVAVGLVAALPLALIPIGDTTYPGRLLIFAIVGAAFGATIGLVAGPGLTSIRPDLPPAVERGTLLRVRHDTEDVRRLLAGMHPIRIDEIRRADDLPIETVATEDSGTIVQTAVDMATHLTGDDYTPDPREGRAGV